MQKKKKKATIKDVTARANTSIITIFRVLSSFDYPVKEELKTAIIDVVKTLDYKPNPFGRLFHGGRNYQIGVVVPSVTSSFYSQLTAVAQKECMDSSYVPTLYSSHNQVQTERSHINILIQAQVTGVLLSLAHWDESINSVLGEAGTSYILLDQPHDDYNGAAIDFDFYPLGQLTAEYLTEDGHREFASASGSMGRLSCKKSFEGLQDALTDHHVELKEDNIFVSTASKKPDISVIRDYQCGQELGSMMLERKRIPDALFTVNGIIAVGIMRQLEIYQVHIPRDMSVLEFDSTELGEVTVPVLTIISQSAYRTGELVAKLLMEYPDGAYTWKKGVILEPILVERESIGKTQ